MQKFQILSELQAQSITIIGERTTFLRPSRHPVFSPYGQADGHSNLDVTHQEGFSPQ
jgi:hypothetical protein